MKLSSLIRSLSRVALVAALAAPLGIAFSSSTASASAAGFAKGAKGVSGARGAKGAKGAKEGKEKKPRVTVDATFERYVLDAHGHVRALLLRDGSLVRAPEAAVRDTSMKAGDALKIEAHAKTTAGVTLYGRALVKKNGAVVVDATKKVEQTKSTGKLAELSATGKISFFLYDRKGAVRGVVLADGTAAHAGKGASLGDYKLKLGDAVTVSGKGGSYALGRALKLESIKLPNGDVKKP